MVFHPPAPPCSLPFHSASAPASSGPLLHSVVGSSNGIFSMPPPWLSPLLATTNTPWLERLDVQLPARPFHVKEVDLVGRVGQMAGGGSQAADEFFHVGGADGA